MNFVFPMLYMRMGRFLLLCVGGRALLLDRGVPLGLDVNICEIVAVSLNE